MSFKNVLSRWSHIGCSLFIYFTSQLKVLACHDDFFFTGQLNVLAFHDSLFFFTRPTQRVGLLHCSQMDLIGFSLLAFPHAREILLEMLTIDSNRKLDAVQFFEHVCIPRQNLINLVRPMPSWRPFTKLFVFSS